MCQSAGPGLYVPWYLSPSVSGNPNYSPFHIKSRDVHWGGWGARRTPVPNRVCYCFTMETAAVASGSTFDWPEGGGGGGEWHQNCGGPSPATLPRIDRLPRWWDAGMPSGERVGSLCCFYFSLQDAVTGSPSDEMIRPSGLTVRFERAIGHATPRWYSRERRLDAHPKLFWSRGVFKTTFYTLTAFTGSPDAMRRHVFQRKNERKLRGERVGCEFGRQDFMDGSSEETHCCLLTG